MILLPWWLLLTIGAWVIVMSWAVILLLRRYGETRWRQGAIDGVKATLELSEVPPMPRPRPSVRLPS